jgi:tetratricopeptide (TPR) repeat protein
MMKPTRNSDAIATTIIHTVSGFLLTVVLAGCGLAMDNEDRLARGELALEAGDHRAAIIDAKDVLLDEPENVRGRLLLGRASVAAGDGPAAEKELRRAIELGQERTTVAVELAQALLLQGKFEQVLTEVPLDESLDPRDLGKLRRIHGNVHLALGRAEQARELFTAALETDPEDLDAQLGVVSTYVSEGNFVQANNALQHVLESNGDEVRAWLFAGDLNARMGVNATAESNYRTALGMAGDTGTHRLLALAGLTNSLIEQEKYAEARVTVDTLLEEVPRSPYTQFAAARLAYVNQDWSAASRNLQEVLRVLPNHEPSRLLLGAVHLQSGSPAQAEMYLSAALAANPDNVRARQLLAEAQLQLRNATVAQNILAPLVSGDEVDAISLQLAARASFGMQNTAEAVDYLRQSAAADPDNIDLQLQLAAILLQTGGYEDAQAVLDTLEGLDSEEHAYKRDSLLFLKAVQQSEPDTALAAAKKLTEDFPDRAGAFNLLGTTYLALRDVEEAKAAFEQASQVDSSDLVSQRYLALIEEGTGEFIGRIAYRNEDLERAAEHYRQASEMAPENLQYRVSLARVVSLLGNDAEAIRILESSDGVTENESSAVVLAALKAKTGEIEEAHAIAESLITRDPENPVGHAMAGEIFLVDRDLESAEAAFAEAVRLGPRRAHAIRLYQIRRELGAADADQPLLESLAVRPLDVETRMLLADYYAARRQPGAAIAEYEKIVKDNPSQAVALNNLAWHYYVVGDPRALETSKRALEAMPDNASVIDTAGWVELHQGDAANAERLLRKAAELSGGAPEILYHHAVALARTGKVEESRKTLQQLLASGAEFSSRQEATEFLAGL